MKSKNKKLNLKGATTMKTLERQVIVKNLGSILNQIEADMEAVVRVKGVKIQDMQHDLRLVAWWLDKLTTEGLEDADSLKVYELHVCRLFEKYPRKKVLGIKDALDYLKTALIEYKGSLLLKDGVYHTFRKGQVDSEDEVIKIVDGKVVWCDGYFYEEYGEATEDELYRVIANAEKIRAEVDADFEEYSTTDES